MPSFYYSDIIYHCAAYLPTKYFSLVEMMSGGKPTVHTFSGGSDGQWNM